MKRVVLLIIGGLALLAIGGFAGWRLHRPGADARAYAEMRLIAVQVSLDEAPPDYVFWAGDSQVELQPGSQRPCGLDFLNGGISGATAASYADYLARLTFKVHPRLAILTIGTNDILVKNNPKLHKPTEQFEAAAEAIIKRLQTLSPRVVVTALPPVGREIGKPRRRGRGCGLLAAPAEHVRASRLRLHGPLRGPARRRHRLRQARGPARRFASRGVPAGDEGGRAGALHPVTACAASLRTGRSDPGSRHGSRRYAARGRFAPLAKTARDWTGCRLTPTRSCRAASR
ncbi:SGNH/GDSL hydrolase family protein [Methylobacterium oryzae CBMB20]